jgi:hypothetical protein
MTMKRCLILAGEPFAPLKRLLVRQQGIGTGLLSFGRFIGVLQGCIMLGFLPLAGAENAKIELSVFRDASAEMTLEQVLDLGPEAFVASGPNFPVLGFTKDAIWLRGRVAAESIEGSGFAAELGIARLSEVDWHVFAEGPDGLQPLAVKDLGLRYPGVTFEAPK